MTNKSKAAKRFSAEVKVTIVTRVPLSAKTFEDALVEARTLKERDVVDFSTDFADGSIEVAYINDDSVEWP